MEEFEESLLKHTSEEDSKIYNKWKDMQLLDTGNAFNDLFLSKTYEKFTKYLLEISEVPKWWKGCDFDTIFIPITRKLYIENLTDNHELIYNKFEEWYIEEGHQYDTDEEYVINFYKYFKDFAESNITDDVKEFTNLHGLAKVEFKREILNKNLEFEKCSKDEIDLVTDELNDLLDNDNINIAYSPIYKINDEVYAVSETDDYIGTIKNHLDAGETITIFSGKINKEGEIIYRYNVNDKHKMDDKK